MSSCREAARASNPVHAPSSAVRQSVCCCSPRPHREKNQYPCELPDNVVVALLKREALLVRVKVHTIQIQQIMDKERLRHLQTKQNQVQTSKCFLTAGLGYKCNASTALQT